MTETLTNETPLAERTISDVETLKALSDPMRLRILEAMVQAPDEAWTVKRLAATLGVGQTKLYHHIAILEERELIRVAGTRVVSGIIETRYRIAQLSVRLDRSLLSSRHDDASAAVEDVLRSLFDTAREDVGRALRSGAMAIEADGSARRGLLRQDLKRLPRDRADEFKRRLTALLEEFDGDGDTSSETAADPDDEAYGVFIALYPMPEQHRESSDD